MMKKEVKKWTIKAHKILMMDYHTYLLYRKDYPTLLDDTAFTVWNCQRLQVLSYINIIGRGLDNVGEKYDFIDELEKNYWI